MKEYLDLLIVLTTYLIGVAGLFGLGYYLCLYIV